MNNIQVAAASFRDPSGFVFTRKGVIYRQVNEVYRDQYRHLMDSGLYALLVEKGMLIPHEEADVTPADKDRAWRIIRPEPVPFVSYPYEWCFSQLKDAALLTLDMQLAAIRHGMCLKDASAYNIQFCQGRPVMIDTLSFEKYKEGEPWVAYRQFCQHFLATIALMAKTDVRLNKLLLGHIDGIPLDLAGRLLPCATWFRGGLLMHVHLHAMSQKKYSSSPAETSKKKAGPFISRNGLLGIVQSLRRTIQKLEWRPGKTEWGDYYADTNYSEDAFTKKQGAVRRFLEKSRPGNVWDLGGNTGVFSRIAAEMGIPVISWDIDPAAVEINYREVRNQKETCLLPLLLDLTNPSPGVGWENRERDSFAQRGPVDCVMALALVHHLAISNNVPLETIASFFRRLCTWLIIEFVPKEDSQVRRLLASRADIFHGYDRMGFEAAFSRHFRIADTMNVRDSARTLYLMEKRDK